jgi:hypothetical protein
LIRAIKIRQKISANKQRKEEKRRRQRHFGRKEQRTASVPWRSSVSTRAIPCWRCRRLSSLRSHSVKVIFSTEAKQNSQIYKHWIGVIFFFLSPFYQEE